MVPCACRTISAGPATVRMAQVEIGAPAGYIGVPTCAIFTALRLQTDPSGTGRGYEVSPKNLCVWTFVLPKWGGLVAVRVRVIAPTTAVVCRAGCPFGAVSVSM